MKIVGVIPARYDSTRFPGKPLIEISGKSIIQRVYERASQSKYINEVFVATDNMKIRKAVEVFGGKSILTSSEEPSGTDRIASAIKHIPCDIVVNIQGDEPFIHPENIDRCVQAMIEDEECMVSTPRIRILLESEFLSPNVVKVVTDKNGYALYFSRSPIPNKVRLKTGDKEEYRIFWGYKHLGLYVYRYETIQKFKSLKPTFLEETEKLEQLRFLENGYKIKVVDVRYDSIGIDTPEDLERVRAGNIK